MLERPMLPPGQERLAGLFQKNTPEKNAADPRLAPAQAIVDAAIKVACDLGDSARAVNTIGESTRQFVAERTKTGGRSMQNWAELQNRGAAPPPRQKDRKR